MNQAGGETLQKLFKLSEGYGQSKWVSEKLLELAQKRGLPAIVYRPGFIGGDCDECYWNPQDTNLAIFQVKRLNPCY